MSNYKYSSYFEKGIDLGKRAKITKNESISSLNHHELIKLYIILQK